MERMRGVDDWCLEGGGNGCGSTSSQDEEGMESTGGVEFNVASKAMRSSSLKISVSEPEAVERMKSWLPRERGPDILRRLARARAFMVS